MPRSPVLRPLYPQGKARRLGSGAWQMIGGIGGGAAFSPLSLAPAMWQRFQDTATLFTTSGGSTNVASASDPIGRAEDKSGNGRHWTQATAGSRLLWQPGVVNGHAVARADGVDDHWTGPDLSTLTAGEVFIVVKLDADPPAADAQTGFWDIGSDTNLADAIPFTDGVLYDSFGSTARKTTVNPTPSLATAFRLYNVVSVSGEWTSFLDGTQLFTTATNTVGFTTTTLLGRSAGGAVNSFLDGDIAEFILFPRKLSAGEKTQMKAYFASRYALTIA